MCKYDDPDVLGVCPNCEQWQRKSNGGDCIHECKKRGFAPEPEEPTK